ncbi:MULTISPECIES: hypothetical protein [Pseudonocardia]|uniref:Uncharacterized protein n=2 Tax=Pseudonocardia TaxID=1847 RepID=A0A1Y2MV63_PSEAH|nr:MULTISPECIES: hypothetical protein [Pseudonocardia]OSY39041.1 hypothetical protein BG845_03610 [Pseudonocardia autotrophica]TDN71362.1 hypothetical protein C8E95_0392 [Pseudonocardia autotrophica]BBG02038.1 hypothetical protein Pdca_32470 [Pseudonocardia autotrophica]GEC23201.1 hypothetical protein PSA01_02300 [Pseudonocardia saturnea]
MPTPPPGPWPYLLDEARAYPSPHNSQPIVVRVLDAGRAELLYDLERGLPAENFGIPFGQVCAGVYVESLATVAAPHGWSVTAELRDEGLDFDADAHHQPLGTVELTRTAITPQAQADLAAFRRRRTSRRPYRSLPVDPAVLAEAGAIAAAAGHDFGHTDRRELVDRIVRINQETLFDDLRNDAVHAEILAWLRTSDRAAEATRDGLSARTLLLPGPLLGFAMRHRGMWDLPLAGPLLRRIYLNTMRGVRELGWLTGPFASPLDHVEAGRVFLRIWLAFTRAGVYLHPFGTVITNPRSHAAFTDAAGIDAQGADTEADGEADGERMAWMLFRYGHSAEPPRALRRELSEMLLDRDGVTPWDR